MKGTFPIHKFRELETPSIITIRICCAIRWIRFVKKPENTTSSVYITLLRPMQILRF